MRKVERLKQLPLLRSILHWRYDRLFATARGMNLFRGVYASTSEALAHVPQTKPIGYDTPEASSMYRDRLSKVVDSDYAPMFWLRGILAPGMRVFDFGGHVGIAYHAYRRYFSFPTDLQWTVCDVGAVVDAGRKLAAAKGESDLHFVTDHREAGATDVVIAFGSLQYVEPALLPALLAQFPARPRHVLVNKLPVHPTKSFVTLQNMSAAFCPYQVFQRTAFIESIERLGYELVDSWTTAESLYIPFPPGYSVDRYCGFYFRLVQT